MHVKQMPAVVKTRLARTIACALTGHGTSRFFGGGVRNHALKAALHRHLPDASLRFDHPGMPAEAREAGAIKSQLAGDGRLSGLQFVSSVEQREEIGLLGVSEQGAFWSGHARANGEHVPNGFGDFLTVLLARDAVGGLKPVQKMLFNEMTVFAPVFDAHDFSEPSEFDVGVLPKALGKPTPARVIPL